MVDLYIPSYTTLENIELPDGLETIRANAFIGATGLGTVTFPAEVTIESRAFEKAGIREINWGTGPLTVGNNAFAELEVLEEVTIPAWMTSIPTMCFYACTSLEEINWEERDEAIKLGDECFRTCTALKSIQMPPSEAIFGKNCFAGGTFTEIKWTQHPITLGYGSFQENYRITSLALPETVTHIPESCFSNCRSLSSFEMTDNVTAIGTNAFSLCGFKTLPLDFWSKNLQSVGINAFSSNSSLESVVYPQWVNEIPGGCDGTNSSFRHTRPVARTTFSGAYTVSGMGFNDEAQFNPATDLHIGIWRSLEHGQAPSETARALYAAEETTDAPAHFESNGHLTGVENVGADHGGDTRWYNLNGMEVTEPQPGQVYIRVTSGHSVKEVYNP